MPSLPQQNCREAELTAAVDELRISEVEDGGDDHLQSSLRRIFGYEDFRPGQREIVELVLSGRDGVVLVPTGGGKTLTFVLPAVISDGITVVVVPTLSLMQDMHDRLHDICSVTSLSGETSSAEKDKLLHHLTSQNCTVKVLITTPETIQESTVQSSLSKMNIARYVIDECHCINHWGYEFRPSYLTLGNVREKHNAQVVAFTATATHRTLEVVQTLLHLQDPFVVKQSFNRENLFLHIKQKSNFNSVCVDVLQLLSTQFKDDPCIIYCLTPSDCFNMCTYLCENQVGCVSYHGNLSPMEKHDNLVKWQNNHVHVIVATKSLGMGIDKPDVRLIIHVSFPACIPEYFQQCGRGGRDSNLCHCFLYYKFSDRKIHIDHIHKMENQRETINAHSQLKDMISLCAYNHLCIKSQILNYFGEEHDTVNCNMCSSCQIKCVEVDITTEARHAILLVQGIAVKTKSKISITLLAKVLKGSKDKEIRQKMLSDLPLYGIHCKYSLSQIENIIVVLVLKSVLGEEDRSLHPGEKAALVLQNKFHVKMFVREKT